MPKAIAVHVFTEWGGLDAIERTAKRRAIAMKSVKAGAKLVQQAAKVRAPKRKKSGALRQSLGIKSEKGKRGKTLAFAVVGARSKVVKTYKGKTIKPAKYAHLVEKGTQAHDVAGKRHPGAKAKPFLKPALDSEKLAAGRVMVQVLGAEVMKALQKQKNTKRKG